MRAAPGNPYPRCEGFGLRYLRAKALLERYARDDRKRPYCRTFDNCFENDDGDAVVWALVNTALRNRACGDSHLFDGIHRLGPNVWPDWRAIYDRIGGAR